MKPFQNKQPDQTYNLAFTDQAGNTTLQTTFHSSDIKPDHMAATDPCTYVETLHNALDEVLNGDQWRDEMDDAFPCEVRPFGSQPTAPQITLMKDRSMFFDPRQTYDGRSVAKGEAFAGSLISMEAPEVGIVVSGRVSILDHTVQFGFTERSIEQSARKLLNDLELNLASKVAESLEGQPSVEKVYAIQGQAGQPTSISPDDLLDILTGAFDTQWGSDLSDYGILIPIGARPALNRAAQRSGKVSVEEMIGTHVHIYDGVDRGYFLIPKAYAMLSFREDREGDVWDIEVSRNGGTQSWELEVTAVLDVMATAMVQVKLDGSDWETTPVALPIIKQVILGPEPEPEPVI